MAADLVAPDGSVYYQDRAYGLYLIKGVDLERRVFSGLATTPAEDRQGHIVDPTGVTFRNPLPLLFHHNQHWPIGTVRLLPATADGIAFEASMPVLQEPGPLKDRVDEAWQSIKAGLITGVSIGLRVLERAADKASSGILRIVKSEILELSLVTIPANAQASILLVKSLAASGPHSSGVTDTSTYDRAKVRRSMTTQEHITNLEASRAAKAGRMVNLMTAASESGTTLDAAQSDEYDGLDLEVKRIDDDLVRFRKLEQLNVTSATPLPTSMTTPRSAGQAANLRGSVISVKPNVPPGTAFVRTACAQLVCHGNLHEAAEYAKRWDDSTPEVALTLKAAIAPGTATDPAWAGPLVNPNIANEFIELLRPATIIGRIGGLRRVPFNTKVPTQTAGGTYGWVGEAKPKPVTKLAFSAQTLTYSKAAGIIVLTEELVRLSNPSAEELVRRDMIAGIAQFLDAQFIDPAVAAVAGVNPASITNGAPTAAATTNPLADIMGLINHFATNNIDVSGVHIIMSAANAMALSFRSNIDGSPQYPGVGLDGGTYRGISIITSNAAGTNVIALQPNLILYADDGGVTIDASREASLQMDSAPASPADATTVYVSLWQTNCVGLRAERWINWLRATTNAVKYLTATAWPAPTGTLLTQEVVPEGREGNGRRKAAQPEAEPRA